MHAVRQALRERRTHVDDPPLADLTGRFHSHVTLSVAVDSLALEPVARATRSKLTVIDLADLSSRTERDVMLTRYFVDDASGALGRIADALDDDVRAVLDASIEPVRVKVEHESEPSLPTYDAEHYHEVHIKLAIPAADYDDVYAWLKASGEPHRWRPSRNPYERRADQVTQFVTMRAYEGTRTTVSERVDRAVAALRARGLDPVEIKRETTVLDTRRSHDAWWA